MITPSFSPTATERVLPKLALDFTTASLDPRVTFTRTTDATHPATYVASNGYITAATNNQPRFDYDPVALTCKGLLIEESRSNLCLNTEDMSAASWIYTAPLAVSSTNAVVAPTGLQTADILSTTNAGNVYQDFSITGTNTHTVSCFVHTSSTCTNLVISAFYLFSAVDNFFINVNPSTGAVLSSTATTYGSQNYGNGWYRFWMTKTGTSAANNTLRLQLYDNVASANTLVVWGSQVEVGAFPTSYIPTTTTSLTRNPDVATMTGTNFSSWFNATEGSMYAKTYIPNSPTISDINIFSISNGTISNKIIFSTGAGSSGNINFQVSTSGVSQAQPVFGSITSPAYHSMVGAYKANSFAASVDARNTIQVTSGTVPSVTTAYLGCGFNGSTTGQQWLQKIMYWPQRLINNEVQAFSKG